MLRPVGAARQLRGAGLISSWATQQGASQRQGHDPSQQAPIMNQGAVPIMFVRGPPYGLDMAWQRTYTDEQLIEAVGRDKS